MKPKENPDVDYVREVKRQIKSNGGYCISSREKNKDTKCPCKEFRESEHGMCNCGIYYKE